MTIHYQWNTKSSDSCYACTRWEQKIFIKLEDVPDLPVHPNCKCSIRAFETNAKEYIDTYSDFEKVKTSVAREIGELKSWLSAKHWLQLWKVVQALLKDYKEYLSALALLAENYARMRHMNMIGVDKYFHAKANAEAAQLGKIGEETAKFMSDMREQIDAYTNLYVKKYH
ncbi:MAG: hypothetical protein COY40_02865 [Alphaproteobacteria bacterium CG_4_10_14_0_8_um_filter_53_9]|nr:MAG: hypothetical protein COY40_02865 [Alphaproteobacteria bacterium CG_4_10_14_0_8_um_filter_53_9]